MEEGLSTDMEMQYCIGVHSISAIPFYYVLSYIRAKFNTAERSGIRHPLAGTQQLTITLHLLQYLLLLHFRCTLHFFLKCLL